MLGFLRLLACCLISTATAIAALGGAAFWLVRDAAAPGPLTEARTIIVPAHRGLTGIAELLARDGVIRHPVTFAAMAALSGRATLLKPGEYEFPAAAPALQALDIIADGRTVKHRLTIPEGLTSPEVVALVRAAPALDGDPGPMPAEGSLFPDTYIYSYGDGRAGLLAHMQRAMTRIVAEMWSQRRPDLPLAKPRDAVILASIVEKETARQEERAHIAGVYINRLRLGMRLQADPTVLFALADDGAKALDRPLKHADLAIDSAYNTYRSKGLPPGPIDNPSRSSLLAAVQPERTDDLYFVADGSGGHVFARTLAEQTRNIAQYQHGTAPEPGALPPIAPLADPLADPTLSPTALSAPERKQLVNRLPGSPRHAVPAARQQQQTARLQQHCRAGALHPCPPRLR